MPNQLKDQTSPYLLQHVDNPVDWHAWNESALQKARQLQKPILLSIGYSACHWCHVMERESFTDEKIAARMNELFLCIKVDREERPDLDKIYQLAHQLLTERSGGWPLTIALTPDRQTPFFSGTYYPPTPRMGLPSFAQVIEEIAQYYRKHRQALTTYHLEFDKVFRQLNPTLTAEKLPTSQDALAKAAAELAGNFDAVYGGFGRAPKFPHPTQLELLLRHIATSPTKNSTTVDNNSPSNSPSNLSSSEQMLELTLQKMAEGGLFDQLGGGFYRYAVDSKWEIPHFEKMLYDNAQLLGLYAEAARYFRGESDGADEKFYHNIVQQTADWVMYDMQQKHGGYASTLDADSEGEEGKYYVWSESELRKILTADEWLAVKNYYELTGRPNFDGAWHFNITPDKLVRAAVDLDILQAAKTKLLTARTKRIRPALDDKILTAWNGLMIHGMASAAMALGCDEWTTSAQRALDFVRTNLWQDGRLKVTSRQGFAKLNGYIDDYAFLASGIIALLQADWRSADLQFAMQICDAMLAHFEDEIQGGFLFTAHDHEQLLHRPKSGLDEAIPSGNAAAVRALFQLGYLLGESRYLSSGEKTLQLFAADIANKPSIYASITSALQYREPANTQIIIRPGKSESPQIARDWQRQICANYRPQTSVFVIPTDENNLPDALALRSAKEKTIAYICRQTTCSPPIHSIDELLAELN